MKDSRINHESFFDDNLKKYEAKNIIYAEKQLLENSAAKKNLNVITDALITQYNVVISSSKNEEIVFENNNRGSANT
ncbi:4227_t:CDS:2 [Acaulospora morrowiae]|uniref:4227_t:CDS:1 n=1 Tax=Acaulospora morrowiae TaxID=94023 RepID=A0A9N8ZRD4_9GLOM|nr:4227_t:CDS:2 [Acaulospora morrowiae]